MKQHTTAIRVGAAFVVAPAVLVLVSGPALAAGGDVVVTNQETVQAHLDASGTVKDARVYEQLAMQGKGSVTVSDPVSPRNLRNLDGFGGFDVKNDRLVGTFDVDGERRVRTVSDFGKALPLKVRATYTLNGKTVQPGDVVGSDGTLGGALRRPERHRQAAGRVVRRRHRHEGDVVAGCRHPHGRLADHDAPVGLHRREVRRGEHGR